MKQMETDEELIKLCLKDKNNFKLLYDKYADIIYNFALYLTGSSIIAEELTQDAFVKFHFAINRFNPQKGKIISYIFKIVQNSFKNIQKRNKKNL